MSIAALLLAAALLIANGPIGIRHRAGITKPRLPVHRISNNDADPLAVASTLDVLAVCLSSGMAMPIAAAAVSCSAPKTLAGILRRAADLLHLGADPDTAWTPPPGIENSDHEALMRLARRSASSGNALALGVSQIAEHTRQNALHCAQSAAQRASVFIAGPLGLCFLPAFVCMGIIPVVVGLAGDVFTSGLL